MASKQDGDNLGQENSGSKATYSPSIIHDSEGKGQEHSFLMDRGDVEQMENGLLELLDNFKQGKLHAFGGDEYLEQMNHVRDLQEKLSKLHFELEEEEDTGHRMTLSEDEQERKSQQKLEELMKHLENLCSSVQNLQQETE